MPLFPGLISHNNPNQPILDLNERQVKGIGIFDSVASRNTLNVSIRTIGHLSIVSDVDKLYLYTGADTIDASWQNVNNWIEIGATEEYILPTASDTILGGIKVGDNLSIDASGVLSATDTNTTYTAGSGLTLTGTSFSHTDTSSQSSSNNTGRTYIQSIGLDTYGHVTSIFTSTETVTDTTYTAGNGLTLSGTTFNVGGTTGRITVAANSIDIASTYEGQTSITKLGTITTGVWNGTQIPITHGGTNATTESGARANILPSYSGNNKEVLRVNSDGTDVEWSCISKDMFCSPNTSPSTTNHIVTNVYRDGQWQEIEVNGLYSSTGTVTVANDAVVIKTVNGKTPTNGIVKVLGTDIERSSTKQVSVEQGLVDIEAGIAAIEDIIKPILVDINETKFEHSSTGGKLLVSETAGSLSKNNTGYFFSEASPGITEIKVQDESATPVSRVAIKAVGFGTGARVGVHNTNPGYPLDITGNTRVVGNIIVTGTVDGVDISELKNTVDNMTGGGGGGNTEEIELFSYFIS